MISKNRNLFLSLIVASFLGLYVISAFDGQTVKCRASNNESTLCVPPQHCRISIAFERTTTISISALANNAHVCCPLNELTVSAENNTNNTSDNFVQSLNPVGLGILKTTECGAIDPHTYVSGLKGVDSSKFPWIVSLLTETGSRKCGGTIITNQYILTTTHCTTNKEIVKVYIYLGTDSESDSIFGIEKLIAHPNLLKSDLGLVRLDRTIEFNAFVQPICLPISEELANYNPEVGYLVGRDIGNGKIKLFVTLNRSQDNSTCIKRRNNKEACMLCGPEECKIGVGSPLFFPAIYLSRTRYVAFHIMWGGIHNENFFSKVPPYMKWITENITP